jgi:hypothetical protein
MQKTFELPFRVIETSAHEPFACGNLLERSRRLGGRIFSVARHPFGCVASHVAWRHQQDR